MKRLLFRIGRVVVAGYAGVLLLVAGCQNQLIYHPQRGAEAEFIAAARERGLQPWRDAKGRLIGWVRPNPRAAHRLVVFHGNAGCALDRGYCVEAFGAMGGGADWEVRIFEYPGYGPRPGSPGKDAFIAEGRAAVQEMLAADPRPIFLLGESIGSGPACALAADFPGRIAGLALVVPFARMQEVAQTHFRWLPTGLLLRDKFDNIATLAGYRGSVVFVVASEDEVVGAAQGMKLHASCFAPKLLISLAGARHNSINIRPDAPWFQQTSAFLLSPP
jgi:alpha-beta hydrolase superfamily lysophospholipase